jgi:hypothetical protein
MTMAMVHDNNADAKSATSYKSTHSSRSGVLERAREYTRKIDETARRAKSLERQSGGDEDGDGGNTARSPSNAASTPRSQSTGRPSSGNGNGNRISTRERAMASVDKDMIKPSTSSSSQNKQHHVARPKPTTPTTAAGQAAQAAGSISSRRTSGENTVSTAKTTPKSASTKSPPRRSRNNEEGVHEAVVSPELLVDALSGHEDGLLAIAERLMEHYDEGYDVMGEAIIDAFADVQKLFQHVVEAAHMEGAAFESSRKEEEIKELKKLAAQGQLMAMDGGPLTPHTAASSPNGPTRHDEFIDQEVKDCLTQAIREGAALRDNNKHMECYQLYEYSCQNASSLLPVDSDHRGRLQLSIARSESMSPDRACAILRYAMDDVLRSGLRAGKVPLPDLSKRADVVLSKPKGHPSMNGNTGQTGVVQSSEEALASLVEEMKEMMGAPVYDDTPLQDVSRRFWLALGDAQKGQQRNEERLEHHLGKLKGDFLLSRAVSN